MGDAVLEDFRGKDCAFVANWLRGKGLRYLHRQIFNILFGTQNLPTVSSDDVICISGVLV